MNPILIIEGRRIPTDRVDSWDVLPNIEALYIVINGREQRIQCEDVAALLEYDRQLTEAVGQRHRLSAGGV